LGLIVETYPLSKKNLFNQKPYALLAKESDFSVQIRTESRVLSNQPSPNNKPIMI
jgi:hypothetical protein